MVGVPTSVAAHWPGLEKGPSALRAAGLLDVMRAAGADVTDLGDRPVERWRPRPADGRPHDVDRAADVVRDAAGAVGDALAGGRTPLVLGGDCTLALSLVAGAVEHGLDVGLLYVDGGQDLMLVGDHPEEPIADSSGMAHMLGLPGTQEVLAGIGPRRPLLTPDDVVFYGFDDADEDEHGLVPSLRFTSHEVTADPGGTAARALAHLTARREHVLVHLDVDVLDFLELPVADCPQYGRGLSLATLVEALTPVLRSSAFAGMTLVEANPDRDDADLTAVRRLAGALGPVLAHA